MQQQGLLGALNPQFLFVISLYRNLFEIQAQKTRGGREGEVQGWPEIEWRTDTSTLPNSDALLYVK